MRSGGLCFSIYRLCTLDVCVRKTSGILPSTKNVSCASRAGWWRGIFNKSKLCFSSSTHGPSAHSKPRCAKISVMRSCATAKGWRCPCATGYPGSVKSRSTLFNSSLISWAARVSVFSSSTAVSSAFKALPSGPAVFLSSIEKSLRFLSSSVNAPLRPNAATRSSSTAARSAAWEILVLYSCAIVSQAVLNSEIVIVTL